MVEVVDSRVEASGVRCLGKAKPFPVQVMAELMQQRVQKTAIGSHLAKYGGAHPEANSLLLEGVIAKELRLHALPAPLRSCPKHAQLRSADGVHLGEQAKDGGSLEADPSRVFLSQCLLQQGGAALELGTVRKDDEP